jgi:hypothetical protein
MDSLQSEKKVNLKITWLLKLGSITLKLQNFYVYLYQYFIMHKQVTNQLCTELPYEKSYTT